MYFLKVQLDGLVEEGHEIQKEKHVRATSLAEQMIATHPSERVGHDLVKLIETRLQSHTP